MPMGDDLVPFAPPEGYATKDSHQQHKNGKQADLAIHDTNKGKMPMYCNEEVGAKVDEGWSITKYFQLGEKSNKNGATQGNILPSEEVAATAAPESSSKRWFCLYTLIDW